MSFIELEIKGATFTNFVLFVLEKSPIPRPSLSLFGPSRLVSRPLEWKAATLGKVPEGHVVSPGSLGIQASVAITHLSIAELMADPGAHGTSVECTSWLEISFVPGHVRFYLIRLEAGNTPAEIFVPPLFITEQTLPLEDQDIEKFTYGAILLQDEIVTLRLSTTPDNLLASPLNLLLRDKNEDLLRDKNGDNWLVRLSAEVFADNVKEQLRKAVPSDLNIEAGPDAGWYNLPNKFLGIPSAPPDGWGVLAGIDVEKENACADVDLSVHIGAILNVEPQLTSAQMDLHLLIFSDASDWDSFRCWIITGGIASVLVGVIGNFLLGLMAAISTLVDVSEFVRLEAGSNIKKDVQGFKKTGSGDSWISYSGSRPLPILPIGEAIDAYAGPHGVVVRGKAIILSLPHTVKFVPDGGHLEGAWQGHYSCREDRWETSYNVQPVVVSDQIVAPFSTKVLDNNSVAVFRTTTFVVPARPWVIPPTVPDGEWMYDAPYFAVRKPAISPFRTGHPSAGETASFILHTSAGIRRFDIGPVGEISPAAATPSSVTLLLHHANCKSLIKRWDRFQQLAWLVDPPPFDYGARPLRQWLLTFHQLDPGARFTVYKRDDPKQAILASYSSSADTGFLEIITDADAELVVQHQLRAPDAEARIVQRWLLPTESERLLGQVDGLSLARPHNGSDLVAVIHSGWRSWAFENSRLVDLGKKSARSAKTAEWMRSLSLPNGHVIAVWEDTIIAAIPYGFHELVGPFQGPAT